jgi:uncharacterized protein (DUF3084 family)
LVQCQEEITKLKEKIEQKLKSQADYYEKIKERDSHLDRFKQLSQQVTLQKQHLAKGNARYLLYMHVVPLNIQLEEIQIRLTCDVFYL